MKSTTSHRPCRPTRPRPCDSTAPSGLRPAFPTSNCPSSRDGVASFWPSAAPGSSGHDAQLGTGQWLQDAMPHASPSVNDPAAVSTAQLTLRRCWTFVCHGPWQALGTQVRRCPGNRPHEAWALTLLGRALRPMSPPRTGVVHLHNRLGLALLLDGPWGITSAPLTVGPSGRC